MNQNRTQQNLLLGFLIISLLIHLLLVFLSKQLTLFPKSTEPERVVVQMRSRELDIPIRPELDKPREKPAERLAEKNQVVEEEMAPQGDSTDDMRPDSAAPPVQQPQQKMMAPQPEKAEPKAEAKPQGTRPTTAQREEATEQTEKAQEQPTTEQAREVPDLNSLMQLTDTTVARLDKDWRQKAREDVKNGDAVWLDSEQDILTSFMRRLRDGIYNVWNYPSSAARAGQEGVCTLSMTFLKDGTVKEVKLLESSGVRILDKAAIAAVRKGGPYGNLPRSYGKDKLTIYASFRYDQRKSRTKGADIF